MAIYTAETKDEIRDITHTVLGLSWAFLIIACLLALASGLGGFQLMGMGPWKIAAIGLYSGLSAVTQCIIAAFVYDGSFLKQAHAKFIYALIPSILQLGSVLIGGLAGYLIAGQLLGMILALYILGKMTGLTLFKVPDHKENFWIHLRRWKRFPMFSLPARLINSSSSQLPILAIGFLYGAEIAARYGVALRSIAIPVGLIGGAALTVFKRDASEEFRHSGNCRASYKQAFRNLIFLSIGTGALIWISADYIFAFGYGESYSQSAVFAKLLLPSLMLGLIASPLSFCIYLSHKQHWDLAWQFMLLTAVSFVLFNTSNENDAIFVYSITYAIFYVAYLAMSWKASEGVKL
jgi:O-antigen/teichoic acid export membrane protein